MGAIILLLVLFLGPLVIYFLTLSVCALDDTLEKMWMKYIDDYEQLKTISNSNRDSYSNPPGMEEGCMLFMGDAILRDTHGQPDRHISSTGQEHNHDYDCW